eukprot:TRINITY_DN82015_c0_g1_i1.p1 TRINITY_DN82015_c0_g1~~TRINITY_DN82015_c0_g1_i1.p1  ORF type:complete len:511 (-),score=152.93 TRINITY_DN82015_c0_g1_i1:80-1612(-)
MSSDEAVAEFVAFTGASPEDARNYLEMACQNLQQAINLFMEMGGGGGGGVPSPGMRAAQAPARGVPEIAGSGGALAAGGDADVAAEVAAVAAAAGIDAADEDAVRAPIAAFDDQIIDDSQRGSRNQKNAMEAAIAADARDMKRRMSFDRDAEEAGGEWTCTHCGNVNVAGRQACFRCGHPRDSPADSSGGKQEKAINKLFAPPAYNQAAPFVDVMRLANEQRKWLLVNIQCSEQFVSHSLNRDVWRDETISELIDGSFVFWQRDNKATEGETFVNTYKVTGPLPCICIIDPRTGRSVKTWDGAKWKSPDRAAELMFGFLDQHSLDAAPKAPSGPPSSAAAAVGASLNTPAVSSRAPAPQAAQQAAQAASTSAAATSAPSAAAAPSKPADEGRSLVDAPVSAAAAKESDVAAAPEAMPEEPGADVEHLKVSFRMPSGQRVTRRFLPGDAVRQMFVVASALSGQALDAIDLSMQFPKRSLRDVDGTLTAKLKDVGVAGNMLLVETGKRRRET